MLLLIACQVWRRSQPGPPLPRQSGPHWRLPHVAPRRSTGLNTVTRHRPDGSVERHFYHRATGRNLGTDRDEAIRLAAELDSPTATLPPTVFSGLCGSYLGGAAFGRLSPKAQKLNRLYIDRLRDLFGSLPSTAITRPVVVRLREREAGRPWYATHLLSKLRLVLQHGCDIGVLASNPALRPGGLHPPRRSNVWSSEQIERFLAAAPADIRLAAALLLYSAQRPADVLAMTWTQIEEQNGRLWLMLRQQKTGELVRVPCHRILADLLRSSPRRGILMVPSPRGLPWAYRNFSRAWDAARAAAGPDLAGLQRRDLRRTAMVQMAAAGATDAQIAAVSGHTIEQTRRILDTYIPRRGEVAAGAIDAWERAPGSRAVHLPKNTR